MWLGVLVYLISLAGTLLLKVEQARFYAVALLLVAAVLAIIVWGYLRWPHAFVSDTLPTNPHYSKHIWQWVGLGGSGLLVFVADVYQAANPSEVFGLAGWLWLISIGMLLSSTFVWARVNKTPEVSQARDANTTKATASLVVSPVASTLPVRRAAENARQPNPPFSSVLQAIQKPGWKSWETAVFVSIVVVAFALRLWNLSDYPNNIYPDEIMTGSVATQSFIAGKTTPVFSTVWSGIDLPALWFLIVSVFLRLGGDLLSMLRLPAALFGAATIIPFYFLMRDVWGRVAAIAGSAILAFSASNVHYSRLALNNIVTQFFWVACFLFLLRGLRSRNPLHWAVAGLLAGMSEHFYYGTRLLPFILVAFFAYLLVVHWRRARFYTGYFALTAFGYLAGFGPLLAYFVTHPNLYFGRGTQLIVWNHIPVSWDDFQQMVHVLGPIISENLLGISTHTSQDIIYFGSLLMVPEAAFLVLGLALLIWKWRHPAAFLVLLAGVGVLFVGGSLVFYPSSVPPLINHWTPAFPLFYCAIAIPIGLWLEEDWPSVPANWRWLKPSLLAAGLIALAWMNVSYYFGSYHADPASLKSIAYSSAQSNYDIQVAQSRYMASLGTRYMVVVVGKSSAPYDADMTKYLLGSSVDLIRVDNPTDKIALPVRPGKATDKGLAFIFFPGNEQYQSPIYSRYPGGSVRSVYSQSGKLAFYTYEIAP